MSDEVDASSAPLAGRTVLVVEDEYLLAENLCEGLAAAGARVLGPIGTVAEALAFLEHQDDPPDRVVLDVNLHGERSYPIADALIRRAIRLVFVTGYGKEALDGRYRDFPHCEKPIDERALISLLR